MSGMKKLAENRINEFQLLICTDAYEIKKDRAWIAG